MLRKEGEPRAVPGGWGFYRPKILGKMVWRVDDYSSYGDWLFSED